MHILCKTNAIYFSARCLQVAVASAGAPEGGRGLIVAGPGHPIECLAVLVKGPGKCTAACSAGTVVAGRQVLPAVRRSNAEATTAQGSNNSAFIPAPLCATCICSARKRYFSCPSNSRELPD
jgi:hypothetical protein